MSHLCRFGSERRGETGEPAEPARKRAGTSLVRTLACALRLPPIRRTDHDVPIDDESTQDSTARELDRARDGAVVARRALR